VIAISMADKKGKEKVIDDDGDALDALEAEQREFIKVHFSLLLLNLCYS
jgi:hypothetical protein